MYQQSTSMQTGFQNQQHCPIADQDMANIVLSELKRMAREYTTASLEANSAKVRHTFEQSLQRTLRDHAELYHMMSQNGMYGQPASANMAEIQKEQQKAQQTSQKLQSFIQQYIGVSPTSFMTSGTQPMQHIASQQPPPQHQQQITPQYQQKPYYQPQFQLQSQPQPQYKPIQQYQPTQQSIGMPSAQTYLNQTISGYKFQGTNVGQGSASKFS